MCVCCTSSGKDEWNTKEGTGNSMKNALYVLWYMAKGTSQAKVTSNSEKIKCIALAFVLVWRHHAVS